MRTISVTLFVGLGVLWHSRAALTVLHRSANMAGHVSCLSLGYVLGAQRQLAVDVQGKQDLSVQRRAYSDDKQARVSEVS